MKTVVLKETATGETRVALVPAQVDRLRRLGLEVSVEAGLGQASSHEDAVYAAAGAVVILDRVILLANADLILCVRPPVVAEVNAIQPGSILLGMLDPFHQVELVSQLAHQGISALSLELIPRSTRAQGMDVLTSQANLAGYVAVVMAAHHVKKIFPMMTTAAGTIAAARVVVVGVGVAGLQAIATARRLGARVWAHDTRPETEEQVRSLGAKFIKVDLGECGMSPGGYARPLTEEQLAQQRDALKRHCAEADVVITAAQVFGRRAPLILTSDILAAMKPGSVVVDAAVDSGGNVEGAGGNQIAERNGVIIISLPNLPARVPVHASQVYSANVANFIEEFWDKEARRMVLNLDDEIIHACLITHAGEVCIPALK